MSCPACGGPLARWLELPAGEPGDERRFELERCRHCATAVTLGGPPGPELYESGVYSPRPPRAPALVGAVRRVALGQPVRMLRRTGLGTGARVLDAGAGVGRLVAALRAAGYDASGIDPSARSVALAADAGGLVEQRSIEQHAAAGLDAVVLWHVLEHLEDPRAALERVRSWLRPGGVVLVGVPNVLSLQAALAGPSWFHFDVPRHRLHLSPAGLEALLAGAGLSAQRTEHMVWEHNPGSMWMAIMSRLGMTPGLPFHLLKRNLDPSARDLGLLAIGLPLVPVAIALEAAAAASRRGGTIAVIARRGA